MEKDDKGSTLIRIGVSGESSFWYRPTRVVPDQRPLNGRRRPELFSKYDTTQLVLQKCQVSLAYLVLFQKYATVNLKNCSISLVHSGSRKAISLNAEIINHFNSVILADRRLEVHFLCENWVREVEIWCQNRNR